MDNRLILEQWYHRYLANDLNEDEIQEFLTALNEPGNDKLVSDLMETTWNEMYPEILPAKKVIPISKNRFIKYLAAASVIAILGIASFVFFFSNNPKRNVVSQKINNQMHNDITPGGDKATLTLADGKVIVLDNLQNGAVTQQGGIKVIKINGQLAYKQEVKTQEVLYNTVSTPKGGQYQLVLADGSKVWLNAASSLRFPTAFNGNERTVELTGEGYFEVTHDATKPFIVHVPSPVGGGQEGAGMDVKVLGTHFNINSYSDEPSVKTTLLEGKVEVTKADKYILLNPGQQAVLDNSQKLTINNNVDVDEVVAWKNGRFKFDSADVRTIMRQAARWYDVEVRYAGKTNETFSGSPSRTSNISQFLKIMEATGKIDFEINGREIIVKPK